MTPAKLSVSCSPWLLLSLLMLLMPVGNASESRLTLSSPTALSSEGFLTLSWRGTAMPTRLQIATDPDFLSLQRSLPLNPQVQQKAQVHISGFMDGIYYARLLDDSNKTISNEFQFQVVHRSLTTAWIIFALGAVLFILLVVVVIRYARKEAAA